MVVIKIGLGVTTVTVATPAVLTFNAHGLVAGDIIYLKTTGALPTNLAINTPYYVIATGLTTNTFRVSLTAGGAAINTTGTQSGVHTLYADRTLKVEYNTFTLGRAITNQVDTLRFSVMRKGGAPSGGYKPLLLNDVEVLDGTQVIFGGQITEIDGQVVDASDIEKFDCICKDYSYDLDKTLVIASYTGMTINAIIADMQANCFPTYDISGVNCGLVANFISFNYEYPSKCLEQLAELVNFDWYVDSNKKIFFFEESTFPSAFDLTDTSGNYYYNTLQVRDNLTSLRNSVYVRGGQYLGTLTSEKQVADGQTTKFTQGYQYNTVFVVVNGVTQTVGIDNIDDPSGFQCLYNFTEKFVSFPSAVPSTQVVEVGGLPYIPVIVKVRDTASVAAYGEHQFKIVDNSINSKEGARDRAKAELAGYSQTINEGTFQTSTSGLDTGQQINIQSDMRGINNDYVISRIDTLMTNGQEFLHTVTLMTSKTYGMIQFLMDLLTRTDKEIVIAAGEVTDEVESVDETITVTETPVVVSISHNPQAETITTGESVTVQALNYAVVFVAGQQTPSGFLRQFVLDGSRLG